ncbi:MAG: PhoH-like ATPase [Paraglaciecola sp.]|jgi:PhoH-like ATPase
MLKTIELSKYLSKGYHTFPGNFWSEVKSKNGRSQGRDTIHALERRSLPDADVNEFSLDEPEHFTTWLNQ